jgi:hypothetical protein
MVAYKLSKINYKKIIQRKSGNCYRKGVLYAHKIKVLKKIHKSKPRISSIKMTKELEIRTDKKESPQTVRNTLKHVGILPFKSLCKPPLSKKISLRD